MRRQTDKTNPSANPPAKPMKVQAPMTVLRRTTTTSGPAPYWRMNPRMVLAFVLPAAIFIYDPQSLARAVEINVCEREMTEAAKRYDVPLAVLYAVGMTETGRRGSLQPFALNLQGPSFFAANWNDALRRFEEARKSGAKLIDVGCMQINHHFHASQFSSLEAMFDPHENVDYAARFLKELRAREGSWTLAAARYHAGPANDPAQKQYVCKVITNMVASGFGAWTANARAFCNEPER
jgi:soluble lytic murein transglycosylase-like protein